MKTATKASIVPQKHEVRRLAEVFERSGHRQYVVEDHTTHEPIEVPSSLSRVITDAAKALGQGRSVTILPLGEELTTQQAADLLGVSHPFLITLLEDGAIPYHQVGAHRRVRLNDVLTYRQVRNDIRRAEFKQMVRLSEEMGLYSVDEVQV
jgi:excisionase family DNA binding protein